MNKKLTGTTAKAALTLLFSAATASTAHAGYACSREEINSRVRVDVAYDLGTGTQIYGEGDARFNQASMTKRLVEYFTYKHVAEGWLNWEDKVHLPGSKLQKFDSKAEESGDKIPFNIGKGKRAEAIVSTTVRGALLAMKNGSSNRAAIGLMIKMFGSEENAVLEMNKWVETQHLTGLASYANTTGYPTTAMKYSAHYTTGFAHGYIVWKIHTEFPEEVKEFSIPNPRITAYTASGRAVPMNLSLTTRVFAPGNHVGHFKIMDFKTGTTCLAGTSIDIVAKDDITGREILYITAGHDPNAGTKTKTAVQFFTNMPENAKQQLTMIQLFEPLSAPSLPIVPVSQFSQPETFAQHAIRAASLFEEREKFSLAAFNILPDNAEAKICPAHPDMSFSVQGFENNFRFVSRPKNASIFNIAVARGFGFDRRKEYKIQTSFPGIIETESQLRLGL